MRYNNYRRLNRYQQNDTPSIMKKLLEQIVTQFIICIILIGLIFGAQWLKINQVEESVQKVKLAVAHSLSWNDIVEGLKNTTMIIMDKGSNEPTENLDEQEEDIFEIKKMPIAEEDDVKINNTRSYISTGF